jgi:hypothetical protein
LGTHLNHFAPRVRAITRTRLAAAHEMAPYHLSPTVSACAAATSPMPFVRTRRNVGAPVQCLQRAGKRKCQQFRPIHNFHRFIHSPSTAGTPFEPVNLCTCWELVWITLCPNRPPINRPRAAERNQLPR